MIDHEELKHLLYEACTKFYPHGIEICRGGWTSYETKDDFDAKFEINTNNKWFEKVIDENLRYIFSRNDILEKVDKTIGYPWNIPITSIFKAYVNGSINDKDVYRYIELIDKNAEKVFDIINESDINFYGTDKFKHALNNYVEWFKSVLNTSHRGINVINCEINNPEKNCRYFKIEFTFNTYVKYAQKQKLIRNIRSEMTKKYASIVAEKGYATYYHINGLDYNFKDNGKKCLSCNKFFLNIQANDWTAIAANENASFMPIMKKIGAK